MDRNAVLKCNVFLTNLPRDFAPLNEVYQEVSSLSSLHNPGSTTYSEHASSTSPPNHPRVPALGLHPSLSARTWRSSASPSFPEQLVGAKVGT